MELELWRALYEEAASFKKLKCWEWMANSHMFGLQNPETGEIGYCSILGNGGEMFGLTVYLGTRGLQGVLDMISGESKEDPLYLQHCLMLSFDSRDELYPEELKRIKALGLTFRGGHAWPTFRLYEPGYVPWPFSSEEHATFFLLALQQAGLVALEYRSHPDALYHEDPNMFLVRIPEKANGEWVWTSRWQCPEPISDEPDQPATQLDELRLARVKKTAKAAHGIWEVDSFFAPIPIKEGDRPFYPRMAMIVDQSSGQILQHSLSEQSETGESLISGFLQLVEQLKLLPAELWASNESVLRELTPIIHALDIQAFLTEELPALQEAKENMLEHLMQI